MNILALDLGSTTGWALKLDKLITSGVQEFKNDRFSGGGMRFVRFSQWLRELHASSNFQAVYFEEVRRHMGVDAAHCYGGFMAHLTAFCEERKIPYQGIPVGTIKKHACGKGNADKQAMVAAACKKFPEQQIADDNHADALWILDTALAQDEF